MVHADITARFSPFVELLCFFRQSILGEPCRGDINTVRALFSAHIDPELRGSFQSQSLFLQYVHDFNLVSANALVLDSEGSKLIDVKFANLELLRKRLSGDLSDPSQARAVEKTKSMEDELISLLERPLRTIPSEVPDKGFDYDLERLTDMLCKETAFVTLGIKRAQLQVANEPFYLICDEQGHNSALANLCLNSKTLGSGFNELPANVKIHRAIASCKSLLGSDVLKCVKEKIHLLPLINSHTDIHLGNCSYLDTCHKMKNCRYLHYYTLNPPQAQASPKQIELRALDYTIGECHDTITRKIIPPQWINCDVRYLPFNILGKFAAIISDPAWDIHMSLPYGTCKDGELLSLPMQELQDEGVLMLWVTGRSIEIGRKAMFQWGYTVSDEMIWIKLNQLRRTIVTGRTGHWLNHSKEHLLVGVKGNPIWLNRKVDLDIIVSGTRETSRKPDELYGIVERLVGKHARKLEIFGRDNNIRPGWLSTCYNPNVQFITNSKQLETS